MAMTREQVDLRQQQIIDHVKQAIEDSGYSIETVADNLGVSRQSIYYVFATNRISMDMLLKLQEFLGIPFLEAHTQ